jgi:hypothetical protein
MSLQKNLLSIFNKFTFADDKVTISPNELTLDSKGISPISLEKVDVPKTSKVRKDKLKIGDATNQASFHDAVDYFGGDDFEEADELDRLYSGDMPDEISLRDRMLYSKIKQDIQAVSQTMIGKQMNNYNAALLQHKLDSTLEKYKISNEISDYASNIIPSPSGITIQENIKVYPFSEVYQVELTFKN